MYSISERDPLWLNDFIFLSTNGGRVGKLRVSRGF